MRFGRVARGWSVSDGSAVSGVGGEGDGPSQDAILATLREKWYLFWKAYLETKHQIWVPEQIKRRAGPLGRLGAVAHDGRAGPHEHRALEPILDRSRPDLRGETPSEHGSIIGEMEATDRLPSPPLARPALGRLRVDELLAG